MPALGVSRGVRGHPNGCGTRSNEREAVEAAGANAGETKRKKDKEKGRAG